IRNTKTGRVGLAYRSLDLKAVAVYDPKDWPDVEKSRVPAAAIEEYEEHHPGTYEIIERNGQPF
ncbi:MAG TPA: hypothetical protein VFT74_17930, partial [Isosphaeraceae bacterium]|nr:hypothetical protein [Isosphaeraceae bacterium]